MDVGLKFYFIQNFYIRKITQEFISLAFVLYFVIIGYIYKISSQDF